MTTKLTVLFIPISLLFSPVVCRSETKGWLVNQIKLTNHRRKVSLYFTTHPLFLCHKDEQPPLPNYRVVERWNMLLWFNTCHSKKLQLVISFCRLIRETISLRANNCTFNLPQLRVRRLKFTRVYKITAPLIQSSSTSIPIVIVIINIIITIIFISPS